MSGYTFKQDLAKAYFGDRCKEIARRELARAIHTNTRLMAELLAADFQSFMLAPLSGERRSAIAESLLRYLSAHLEIPLNIRSLSVLGELYR